MFFFDALQLEPPLSVDTSLCHVVVTWEQRPLDTRNPSAAQFFSRPRRPSTSSASEAAAHLIGSTPPTDSGFPVGSPNSGRTSSRFTHGVELSEYGFPGQCLVEDLTTCDPVQLAFELSSCLWKTGVSTQLFTSETKDPIDPAVEIGADFSVRVCLSTLASQGMISYKIWNLAAHKPVGEPIKVCQPSMVLSHILHTLKLDHRRCEGHMGGGSSAGGNTPGSAGGNTTLPISIGAATGSSNAGDGPGGVSTPTTSRQSK